MSGIGPSELIVLVVIGLLILGPERLPRVASQIGRWVGKARRTANQLRYQLEREVALADIEKKSKKSEPKGKPEDNIAGSRDSGQAGEGGGSDTGAAEASGRSDSSAEAAATGAGADSNVDDGTGAAPPGDDQKTG